MLHSVQKAAILAGLKTQDRQPVLPPTAHDDWRPVDVMDLGLAWLRPDGAMRVTSLPLLVGDFVPIRANGVLTRIKIERIRIQRLHDISEDEAQAEGVETDAWDMAPVARRYGHENAWFVGWSIGINEPCISVKAEEVIRRSFRSLWELIHGPAAWSTNPWVLVHEFAKTDG